MDNDKDQNPASGTPDVPDSTGVSQTNTPKDITPDETQSNSPQQTDMPSIENHDQNNTHEEVADTQSDDKSSINTSALDMNNEKFIVDVKDGSSRKKKLILLGIALALVLAVFAGYWFIGRGSDEEATTMESTAEQLTPLGMTLTLNEGTVEYSTDNGTLWQPVDDNTQLMEGYLVRTADDELSRAIVTFDDGSVIRLNNDTEISLQTSTTENISAEVKSGRAYARVVPSESRNFELTTRRITAQALGTAFIVGTSGGTDTIEVYQSTVKESGTDTTITEGKYLQFNGGNNQSTTGDLNIETVKNDPFINWNREKDQEDENFKDKLGFLDDFEAPNLTITAPLNNATIKIPVGSTTVSTEIAGTTEPGLTVKVANSDGATQEVTAAEDGSFKVTMTAKAGKVTYTATSTDARGNTSKLSVAVTYVAEVPETVTPDITLGAVAQPGKGIVVNWSYKSGFEAPDGVKVLWNKSGNLTFPVETAYRRDSADVNVSRSHWKYRIRPAVTEGCFDDGFGSKYIKNATSATICLFDANSYAVRVCRYDSATGKCNAYSNEVRITAPGGSD